MVLIQVGLFQMLVQMRNLSIYSSMNLPDMF